jgi:hypothetical protein
MTDAIPDDEETCEGLAHISGWVRVRSGTMWIRDRRADDHENGKLFFDPEKPGIAALPLSDEIWATNARSALTYDRALMKAEP